MLHGVVDRDVAGDHQRRRIRPVVRVDDTSTISFATSRARCSFHRRPPVAQNATRRHTAAARRTRRPARAVRRATAPGRTVARRAAVPVRARETPARATLRPARQNPSSTREASAVSCTIAESQSAPVSSVLPSISSRCASSSDVIVARAFVERARRQLRHAFAYRAGRASRRLRPRPESSPRDTRGSARRRSAAHSGRMRVSKCGKRYGRGVPGAGARRAPAACASATTSLRTRSRGHRRRQSGSASALTHRFGAGTYSSNARLSGPSRSRASRDTSAAVTA